MARSVQPSSRDTGDVQPWRSALELPVSLDTICELYAYNRGAQDRALAMAEALSEQDLTRDMGHSHGSVAALSST